MAWITIANEELTVALTRGEKVAGLRGDVRVPVTAVREVRVAPDALAAARGLRSPGLALPGMTKIGTWRGRGRRQFVVARRGVPAVHLFLSGARYDELIVSLPGAERVAEGLRAQLGLGGGDGVRELQVSVPGRAGRLAGALTLPPGAGPHPAALLLPGSGPIDRNADLPRMPLGVSRDLARALADRGIATLRFDKRGVGGSDGSFLHTGLYDNAEDARAALAWLRERPEVREDAAFVVGHSEGATLALLLGDEPLAGVVLLAGAAKSGDATLAWQARQIAPGLPKPVRLLLRALRVDIVAKQAKNAEKLRATTTDSARMGGRKVNARWLRELMAFDPADSLARLRAPVLAITGSKDIQVDPADLERIAELTGAETVLVPDLTHLLRRDPGVPRISAYKRLARQPIDPEVGRLVGDWIAARAAAPEVRHAELG